MVDIFLEDVPLSKHISFDSATEKRCFLCLCNPVVCQMRGPPQSSWVLKWGSWSGLCHPPMALPCDTAGEPAWAAEVPVGRSQPNLALHRSWPVKNHCRVSPGATPGVLQLSEVYGLSHSSVNILACLSHRARRTGHPKSSHLMVLAALKVDAKLGRYAILYNKWQGSPSAKSKGDQWSAVSGSN